VRSLLRNQWRRSKTAVKLIPLGLFIRISGSELTLTHPGFSEKSSLCRGTASRKCSLVQNISPAVPLRSKPYCYRASDRAASPWHIALLHARRTFLSVLCLQI
jgi:hypothetical protein